jgi:hypothetical protein
MKTFNKDKLIHVIQECTRDVPIFYYSGFENLEDFLKHDNTNKGIFIKFLNKHNITINDIVQKKKNITSVFYSPQTKNYTIEQSILNKYCRIPNHASYLKDIKRFFAVKCEQSISDKTECALCYEDINHNLSDNEFNKKHYSCFRCHNMICVVCFNKTIDFKTKSHVCSFCKIAQTFTLNYEKGTIEFQ